MEVKHGAQRKTDEYIGRVSSVDNETVARWESQVAVAKTLAAGSASLRLFGYQRAERKPAAVLEVFFNRGLIQAGLTLVGSHAYGALLNEKLLDESGLAFVPVPGMPSQRPSASYKLPSGDLLAVDLLMPARKVGRAIPLLDFLVDDAFHAPQALLVAIAQSRPRSEACAVPPGSEQAVARDRGPLVERGIDLLCC